MHDDLVKRLRNCVSDTVEDCAGCPYQGGYKGTYCMNGLITEAADAIEELQGKIEELYCLAQDVNRNEIAGHISENNLDAWLYAFQRYAAKIAKKPLQEPPKEG